MYNKDSITPGMIERNYEYLKKFRLFVIENGGQQAINLNKMAVKNISILVVRAGFVITSARKKHKAVFEAKKFIDKLS